MLTRVPPPVPRDYPAARVAILNRPTSPQRIEAPLAPGARQDVRRLGTHPLGFRRA